jgi:hypothetical protein
VLGFGSGYVQIHLITGHRKFTTMQWNTTCSINIQVCPLILIINILEFILAKKLKFYKDIKA